MVNIRKIAKNLLYILSAQFMAQLLNFVYMLVIARVLRPEGFGVLSFGLVFTGIFGGIVNIGLRKVHVRDLAREPEAVSDYTGKIIALKVLIAIPVAVVMVVVVNLMGYPPLTRQVVYILTVAFLLEAIITNYYAVFQSQQNMRFESFATIFRGVVLVVTAFLAERQGLGVIFLAWVYLLINTSILAYCTVAFGKEYPALALRMDRAFIREKIREATPFGLVGIFEIIYHWIGTVMLSLSHGDAVVGWYNAAYRVFLVTLFIPSVVSVVVFPVMAQMFKTDPKHLRTVYFKYYKYLLTIGCIIAVEMAIFSDEVVQILYGTAYAPSAVALRILMVCCVLMSINGAFVRLLESTNEQLLLTKICGAAATTNVLLNLLLIPHYGLVGASFATVASESVITLSTVLAAARSRFRFEEGLLRGPFAKHFLRVAGSAAVAAVGAWLLAAHLNMYLAITLSTLIYLAAMVMVGGINREDWGVIVGLLRRNQGTAAPAERSGS
ncbi:MAG: flippase [Magnetococcales bacterium]|nr:flippase [Magnetococcales bacterium]